MKNIVETDGVLGLWKGFGAGLLTYGPFVGVYFVCYEKFKSYSQYLSKKEREEDIPVPYILLSGGTAGAISASVTCPLDVIKTRIQIEKGEEYSTIRRAVSSMIAEGYGVFWKGLSARVMWIAPSCAITLGVCKYNQKKK